LLPTSIQEVAAIVGAAIDRSAEGVIDRICIDSRLCAPGALFVALNGQRTNGHRFVADASLNGATAALVSQSEIRGIEIPSTLSLLVVPDSLSALQLLARSHRLRHIGQVLAITGSNGKTIVKDALQYLLAHRNIMSSPGSFNSQLGLPLAVLSGQRACDLAILEVGVSEPGEMNALEKIAAPSYGILTNVGMAHFASFGSREAIANEKMSLFKNVTSNGWVLLPDKEKTIDGAASRLSCKKFFVGGETDPVSIEVVAAFEDGLIARLLDNLSKQSIEIRVRTRSLDVITDLRFAASAARLLGEDFGDIAGALDNYLPASTRAELWSSVEGIRIINDAHTSDPLSVRSALRSAALGAPDGAKKIFVFAGMRELGDESVREHEQVGLYAAECGFDNVYLLGNGDLQRTALSYRAACPEGSVLTVHTVNELVNELVHNLRWGDTLLLKGPRSARMDQTAREVAGTLAQRCAWIDLGAIADNLARFERHCGACTTVMAMLKALAYGTEFVQLSSWLSLLGVKCIGVSSTNEGVAVRRSGADQDIYVFLPDVDDLESLRRWRLTPILFSPEIVDRYLRESSGIVPPLDVHLKVDTGMHRLGLDPQDVVALARRIRDSTGLRLSGVCTHFAAADDPSADQYTRKQIAVFDRILEALKIEGFTGLDVHAANTSATIRFPEAHYSMVRIGLGLYGISLSQTVRNAMDLRLAIGVTSRVASIRTCQAGAALGYNCTYIADREIRVGIVPFGYYDGMPRILSNRGYVLVAGVLAKVLGIISMDQMLVDLTEVPGAVTGTEVLIYGSHNGSTVRPEDVAELAETIPHELLTRLGKRVPRIYLEP